MEHLGNCGIIHSRKHVRFSGHKSSSPITLSVSDSLYDSAYSNVNRVGNALIPDENPQLIFHTVNPAHFQTETLPRVSIASEQITWAVDKAWVVPVIPDDASAAKRDAMTYLGKELSQGMRETETYPIVSYDGNQLVMDAGSYDKFTEYVMTRR